MPKINSQKLSPQLSNKKSVRFREDGLTKLYDDKIEISPDEAPDNTNPKKRRKLPSKKPSATVEKLDKITTLIDSFHSPEDLSQDDLNNKEQALIQPVSKVISFSNEISAEPPKHYFHLTYSSESENDENTKEKILPSNESAKDFAEIASSIDLFHSLEDLSQDYLTKEEEALMLAIMQDTKSKTITIGPKAEPQSDSSLKPKPEDNEDNSASNSYAEPTQYDPDYFSPLRNSASSANRYSQTDNHTPTDAQPTFSQLALEEQNYSTNRKRIP